GLAAIERDSVDLEDIGLLTIGEECQGEAVWRPARVRIGMRAVSELVRLGRAIPRNEPDARLRRVIIARGIITRGDKSDLRTIRADLGILQAVECKDVVEA